MLKFIVAAVIVGAIVVPALVVAYLDERIRAERQPSANYYDAIGRVDRQNGVTSSI